jgi:hypothetical protein
VTGLDLAGIPEVAYLDSFFLIDQDVLRFEVAVD